MALKTEKELSEGSRSHWLKAVAAMEMRNLGYAISLLQGILKQEPEFLTGRQLLRRAEITKARAEKKKFFNVSTASIGVLKAQRELKKDPAKTVELIENVLEDEPFNRQANLLLKQAASAAGWNEIAVFALQTLLEHDPQDVKILHELGELYGKIGEADHEVEIYTKLAEINPLDTQAVRRGKDASARASMKTGGWTQAGSYRDLIKDKDAAVSLEQQSRMQLSGESLEQQIAEAYASHQEAPQSVDAARRLGALHEQKEDFDSAIAWFQYAADLTNGSDAGVIRKVSELNMRKSADAILQLEAFLATQPADPVQAAEAAEALAVAKRAQAEFSVDDAKRRSDRNPTDLQLRFELGEHLLIAGRLRDALPELQRARQNPNARLRSMNLLGRCYRELGMLDLAVKQLEEAAREIISMDAMKKEIVYNLGLVYEQMGEGDRSIAAMKQIYEADYGYRDVASRVESSYSADTSTAAEV